MCGIAGIIRFNNLVDRNEIERMTRTLFHRGPDGKGYYFHNSVALGHCRLAIIDLETGQQPMSNEDGTVWITYNGEIYNYRVLRDNLLQKGHRFKTRSDTEVVVHAYEEWGTDCVQKFRGMFAFGVVDLNNHKLFLARDHFGIKPLYYRVSEKYIAFASELQALRQVDDAPAEGNLQSIDYFLRFQYIPTPYTIYKKVFKLPPASYVLVDFNGRYKEPIKYWDIRFEPEEGVSEQEWEKRAEEVIGESVKAHLVADVPFGVFLSGGIDSTLVTLKMSEVLHQPIKAFSIGFGEKEYSELAYAKEVAGRCGIDLYTEYVGEEFINTLPDLVAHYGEPYGDSSTIPTWHVSRLARQHVPMVLSGDGGDETFGGYESYVSWMYGDAADQARRLIGISPYAGLRQIGKTILQQLTGRAGNNLAEWQKIILYMDDRSRQRLWKQEYHCLIRQPCDMFEESGSKAKKWDRLAFAQYVDYQTYLPCDILPKVDVASMYHGLEVRVPLLDLRVIELASRLPLSMRFRQDGTRPPVGKYVIKQIIKKYFPSEFVYRKKQGFAIPRSSWFLPGRYGRQLLENVLLAADSCLYRWFNPDQIRTYLALHDEKRDNSGILWLLLVLGLWLEQNPEVKF